MSDWSKFETVIITEEGCHLICTVNRPDALNALNNRVLNELAELCHHIDSAGPKYRSLTLQGAGDKAFVAGADIAGMQGMSTDDALAFARLGQRVTTKLEELPLVTIAAVDGYALGGGCELAMACDLVIATEKAQFGQPEVNLGLIAGFGGTQRLVSRVGPAIALDMLLCGKGRTISGAEALQLGLASRQVATEELPGTLSKIRKSLEKAGPRAVRETKRLVRQSRSMDLASGLASEATSFANCFGREESQEGIAAFLGKRSPQF